MARIQYACLKQPPRSFSRRIATSWIRQVVRNQAMECGDLLITFCADDYLLDINRRFLDHDYYTDIITFDYTEGSIISGEIYISLDRVYENAGQHKTDRDTELHRVIIHGVLHLCGYKDKTKKDQAIMRSKEDSALKLRPAE